MPSRKMIFVALIEVSGCAHVESAGLEAQDVKPGSGSLTLAFLPLL
jgi:hypothetical protein